MDIAVIGAGAAGLAAASVLTASGHRLLTLEARDRVGGRVSTVRHPGWPLPVEHGAEFIHGRPSETWKLVHAAGLRAYDAAAAHWQSEGGQPSKQPHGWEGVQTIMDRLDRVPAGDLNFLEFLDRECADQPADALAMARAMVEGLDAADAAVVSSRSIRASNEDGDAFDADTPFRIFDGYDHVLEELARPLPAGCVLLNTVVRSIRWSHHRVTVETADGVPRDFDRAIVTLPIGVLRASEGEPGAVRFEPPLPAKTRDAIDLMRMGPVVKILLRFRTAFWEQTDWRDLSFLHDPGGPVPTWWTMLPCRVPLLTGWAGGPAAAALSHRPADEVMDIALKSLARLLGVVESLVRRELAASHVADWQSDPYSRGAYAYAAVGGADAAKVLSEPIDDTIFLAGEATHPGYAGTVAAAIASGRRAAGQLMSNAG